MIRMGVAALLTASLVTSLALAGCGKDDPPAKTPDSTRTDTGTGTTPRATDAIGYAEVQAILRGLGKPAKGAPHGNFWDEDYKTFVEFEFEEPEEGVMIRAITPWRGAESNLVKALRSGKGITGTRDGETVTVDVARMPNKGPYLSEADIKKIERWIDLGAPQVAGQPSTLPKPK